MRLCLFTALLFFTISACTWRAEYLEEVKGRANQDDIAQRLGAPTNTHKLNKGGEVWTYEVCSAGGTLWDSTLFHQTPALECLSVTMSYTLPSDTQSAGHPAVPMGLNPYI